MARVPGMLGNDLYPAGWVSRDVALGRDGTFRPEVLKGHVERLELTVDRARAAAAKTKASTPAGPHDCAVTMMTPWSATAPAFLPEQLIAASVHIVTGRVVDISEGFLHGIPGSLLRIDAVYLKGTPSVETYVYFPSAKIRTARGVFCAHPPPGHVRPDRGDVVFIFSPLPAPTTFDGRVVFTIDIPEVFASIRSDGHADLPRALKYLENSNGDTREAILALIEGRAKRTTSGSTGH